MIVYSELPLKLPSLEHLSFGQVQLRRKGWRNENSTTKSCESYFLTRLVAHPRAITTGKRILLKQNERNPTYLRTREVCTGTKTQDFPDRKSTRLNSSHLGISYA